MNDSEIINWYQTFDPEFNLKRIEVFNKAIKYKYQTDSDIRKLANLIGLEHVF